LSKRAIPSRCRINDSDDPRQSRGFRSLSAHAVVGACGFPASVLA
jgi:hypothetical protein